MTPNKRQPINSIFFLRERRAGVRLWFVTFLFLLLIFSPPSASTAVAATPAGTVISNIATLNYQVNANNMAPKTSNTNSFTVLAANSLNQGLIATDLSTSSLFKGNTFPLNITLTNEGSNNLDNGLLTIRVNAELNFELNHPNATLQSQSTVNNVTTYVYNVTSVPIGSNISYPASLEVPANTSINSSEFSIHYQANSVEIDNNSNTLTLKSRTQGVLQLLQYSADSDATPLAISPTEFMQSNGLYAQLPVPIVEELGIPATSAPIPVKTATNFSNQQIIFIQLDEADHNLNPSIKETVEIDFDITNSGETERLRLTETEPNSGVFTGYITINNSSSPVQKNGILNTSANTKINVTYTDDIDNSDSTSQIILVDPFGILFDSATGALLNGYTIAMVNADTGQPAQVFGDDGISTYPATVITGGTVTDSGGTIYNFDEGAYRFPFAPLGNYRLIVTQPSGSTYIWPSQQTDALINQLPNAPYAITLGSRGETFPLQSGPPLHIDIPLDRLNSPLYVQRTANVNTVSAGDFIHFTVTIENMDSVDISQIQLTETLPQGFRLEPNSIRIDNTPSTTPTISSDGQTLTFNLATLNAGSTLTLEYVVAIGAINSGVARSQSVAVGNGGAAQSNTATLKTQITEDLMRSYAILMGQVIIENNNNVAEKPESKQGLQGIRIYMEDGRYAITDQHGMYHFDHVKPGSHVVQLDLDTLPAEYETVLSQNNTRFAGRAWSQFVDVQGGTLWRTDFHVALKPKPQGELSLQISNSAPIENNEFQYSITLENQTIELKNQRLTVMVPPNVRYQSNSSTFQNAPISEPKIIQNMLTFSLGDSPKNSQTTLRFSVITPEKFMAAEMISKAFLVFDTPDQKNQRTPVVTHTNLLNTHKTITKITENFTLGIQFDSADDQINAADKRIIAKFAKRVKGLNNLNIHAVGHSDNRTLLPKTKLRFKNNKHLSEQRAIVIANELRKQLNLPPSQLTVEGAGASQPIASNNTVEGRKANRRVELYVYSDQITQQAQLNSLKTQQSEKVITALYGSHQPKKTSNIFSPPPIQSTPEFNPSWLAQQPAGITWVYPPKEQRHQVASTRIVIKHNSGQKITLLKDGQPVEPYNFEGVLVHQKMALSTWKGVDINPGNNQFVAIITNKEGNEIKRITRTIHFATEPVNAEIMIKQSTLVADGLTNPIIAIRLLDKDGYPVRNDTRGNFDLAPPYKARPQNNFNIDVMPSTLTHSNNYQTTEDGIAFIELEPTTESGEVRITLPFAHNRKILLTTKLTAKATPWILVGLAQCSIGYQTLRDKSIALTEREAQETLYQDNRIAFFAKGRIQGKWLMTIAYDSTKKRPNDRDPELFQTIDPDTYYTLYGDTAYNGYAAPSSEKLYLKLEKEQFYFLFGDYQTALNKSQLAKYDRTLTGIKSHYQDERYDVIVFASQTNQAFVKDEFQGKGITGPYQLSRSNIAMNSEKLIIEVRDRLRSEVIVSTTELSRHQDYQIDYQTGIITFRTPIFSTDTALNPKYIIVKYESFDSGDRQFTYGGRAKAFATEQLSVGVSHINEGRTGGEARLDGVDLTYQLNKQTKLTLEAAQSIDQKTSQANLRGTSYLAEVVHQTERSQSKLYLREQGTDFGLGQTNASENGLRKIGVETAVKTHDNLTLKAQAYQQKSTISDLTRDVFEAEGRGKIGKTDLNMGLRTAQDQENSGLTTRSHQVIAGAKHRFIDNKLTTSIQREQNINDDNSIDFPDRTRLGISYQVSPKTSLFIEQDISDGALRDSQNTLIGIKSSPWQGGEVYSGLTQSNGSEGNRTLSNVSARQTWSLNDQWRLDLGAEEVKLLNKSDQAPLNNSPFVSQNNDEFTAGSIGITYFPKTWMWSMRVETRNGTQEDRWQLATSIQTNPNSRLSTLTTLAFSDSQQKTGVNKQETALRLGLAYRPLATPLTGNWMLLNKLDLKQTNTNSETGKNWRVINNFNANYKQNRWQLALQYAAKTVNETINSTEYNSFTDLTGFETRYDVTPKWDIGLHGNILRSVSLNQYDYQTGFSVGRTVAKNMWLSIGYNLNGFYDEDFPRSRQTQQGAFLQFNLKFDQATVRDAVQWVGQ